MSPQERFADPPLRRLAGGLLVVLAFALPFEAPLFHVGPLQITSVELVLYATLAAWGLAVASVLVRGGSSLRDATAALREDRLARATVVWAVVLFASALAAPSYRAAAFKFALRSLSGILVFFAARSLARSPKVSRRVLLALTAGALVSAGTALGDWLVPGADIWTPFRASSFETFGLQRASGVFAYPTIAAMYWEAAIPLVVVAPLLIAPRRGALAVLVSCPLFAAILASATRSGLAGAAVACAALLSLGWRSGAWLRRVCAAVLCVLALSSWIAMSSTASGSLLEQRLRWWQDDAWFRAEYEVERVPRVVLVGETFRVPVRVRNTGTLAWPSAGARPFRLGYHWEPAERSQTVGDYEGQRTDLPADVPPGQAVDVVAVARGPDFPGVYHLRWDLLEEHVTWFSERGNEMPAQSIVVANRPDGAPPPEITAAHAQPFAESAPPPAPRPALWRAALVLWRQRPLLGIGPDNFRRRYEDVIGLAPNGLPYTDTRIHANSFYLETLADLGLAGAVALACIGLALVRALRCLSASGRLVGLGCGVAAGAFFIHGWIDYFLEFTPLFGLFWMLLGLTAALADEAPPRSSLPGT
jgi:hypothetical protein